jgi:DNA replication protein DnaC
MKMETLTEQLTALGLHGVAAQLDDIVALATKRRFGPRQTIEHFAALETQDRARRSLERRSARSRIGRFKPMAEFDWAWPRKIDREAVESALRLDFLDGAKNVILVAPQGLGKTMIARNICHHAVVAGHSALFITAAQCLLDLAAQDSARGLERRLKHYCRPAVLCLDEIGYLSYDNRNADLLFQLISRRYEHKSLILTTNLKFSDWPTIFPNATCTTALIDRTVHHSEILVIEGDSYRRREAEQRKKTHAPHAPKSGRTAPGQPGPEIRAST